MKYWGRLAVILLFLLISSSLISTAGEEEKITIQFALIKPSGTQIIEKTVTPEQAEQCLSHCCNYHPNPGDNKELITLLTKDLFSNQGITEKELQDLLTPPQIYYRNNLFKYFLSLKSSFASETFCSIASGGSGKTFPIFMIPRPRLFMSWQGNDENDIASTTVGSLYADRGFTARGGQNGYCFGFIGLGLTYGTHLGRVYGFTGYCLYTSVNAEDIEHYPPNRKPVISEPNPSDNQENIPLSLTELSFDIYDADNDLMSYTVTTNPDIGSGMKNNKRNGRYSIDISGLQSSKTYSWTISVSDGKDTFTETYEFTTVFEAPVISNPIPSDGSTNVQIDSTQLSFTLTDPQDDLMNVTVETSPNIGYAELKGVSGGTFTVPINGLEYYTKYNWYVNVTDGTYWKKEKYNFTTLPEGIVILYPTDDADIVEAHPNRNYGDGLNLRFRSYSPGWIYQTMIKFDMSSLNKNDDIIYAKLNLYYHKRVDNNPSGDVISLYRATQNWDENSLTWNTQPPISTMPSSQTIVPSSPKTWMQWDITNDITDFANGNKPNYGWLIKDDTSWGGANIPIGYWYSKENDDLIPYLEIGINI